jgi:hypothetical protein
MMKLTFAVHNFANVPKKEGTVAGHVLRYKITSQSRSYNTPSLAVVKIY